MCQKRRELSLENLFADIVNHAWHKSVDGTNVKHVERCKRNYPGIDLCLFFRSIGTKVFPDEDRPYLVHCVRSEMEEALRKMRCIEACKEVPHTHIEHRISISEVREVNPEVFLTICNHIAELHVTMQASSLYRNAVEESKSLLPLLVGDFLAVEDCLAVQ